MNNSRCDSQNLRKESVEANWHGMATYHQPPRSLQRTSEVESPTERTRTHQRAFENEPRIASQFGL